MERETIKLNPVQSNAVETILGFQIIVVSFFFGLAAIAGIVYRLDAIKNSLGL